MHNLPCTFTARSGVLQTQANVSNPLPAGHDYSRNYLFYLQTSALKKILITAFCKHNHFQMLHYCWFTVYAPCTASLE